MYGMELSFLPGKSAVVLRFQGPGKKSALQDLFKADNLIRINKLPNNFRSMFISVVDTYKHLGTQISFKGMSFELAFRCGLMRAETCKLRSMLRNSELIFYKKIHLIQAYLLSSVDVDAFVNSVECSRSDVEYNCFTRNWVIGSHIK